MHYFFDLFDKVLYMFRTSTVHHQEYLNTVYTAVHSSSVDCLLAWSGSILTSLADSQRN